MDLLTTAEEANSYFNNGKPIHAGSELAIEMSHVPGKLHNILAMLSQIQKEIDNTPKIEWLTQRKLRDLIQEAKSKIIA